MNILKSIIKELAFEKNMCVNVFMLYFVPAARNYDGGNTGPDPTQNILGNIVSECLCMNVL